MLVAGLVRMTGMASAARSDGLEPLHVRTVALVVDERPRSVQRRGPEIIFVPAHDVASRIADAAIDAFDRGVGGEAARAVGPNGLDRVLPVLRWRERTLGPRPLLEERPHVGGEVIDDRQVLERADRKAADVRDARHV